MLRHFPLAAAAALLALAPAEAKPRLSPEQQLAKEIEGRVAGEPVNCISLYNIRSSRIIDDTAIIYDAGRTIYVNRPRAGAESLDKWDTMVTRLHSSQLCSVDTVKLVNSPGHFMTGLVFLGDFVPYRKPR